MRINAAFACDRNGNQNNGRRYAIVHFEPRPPNMLSSNDPREILVASYQFSARRVIEALEGGLAITNSRHPFAPPPTGDVVGLCGQGGRHSYFRVTEALLKDACTKILALHPQGAATSSPLDSLAELQAISGELRRQAVFIDQTGCVNDKMPELVPLLPPEEIWYNGRELPLDVWRLLSLDTDLVSLGIAADVPLDDIAFGSLSQAGLAFRAIMSRLENSSVEIALTGENFAASFPTSLTQSPQRLSTTLARIFFEAGCLLTPLAQSSTPAWYAALRYAEWIAKTQPRLSVRNEYQQDSFDARYRGLFAEEIAIGIMATVLQEIFHAQPINNTVEVLPPAGGLTADFVAKAPHPSTGQDWTIIAESKGSLGRPVSKARVARAKKQAGATMARFSNSQGRLPLAFCSTVPFESQKSGSTCRVIDPPSGPTGDDLLIDTLTAWRVAYAKAFRFVGLEAAAHQALHGYPVTGLHIMDDNPERSSDEPSFVVRQRARRSQNAYERFKANLLLDAGPCAIGIDPRVLGLLRRQGVTSEVATSLGDFEQRERVRRPRERSFLNYLGFGCIFYAELDES
jgi:hypothetical protein